MGPKSDQGLKKKGRLPGFVPVSNCWSGCTRPPTLSAAFLVCCVAAGSALCACIDRVGLKGSPSTLRRAPQSQRKSRRVESAGLLVPTRSSSEAAADVLESLRPHEILHEDLPNLSDKPPPKLKFFDLRVAQTHHSRVSDFIAKPWRTVEPSRIEQQPIR